MIDPIGVLTDPPFEEGGERIPLEGWHYNVTPEYLAERPDLAPFVVQPATLRQVWLGDDPESPTSTIPLRFADEAEALTYFPESE